MRRFAFTVGALAVVTTAGVIAAAHTSTATRRLRGVARSQITTKADLEKKLKAARSAFKRMRGMNTRSDVDKEFLKLRRRLDDVASDSSGFFPEANDMNDAALRDLLKARDAAYDEATANLDAERRRLRDEEREARAKPFAPRTLLPWER